VWVGYFSPVYCFSCDGMDPFVDRYVCGVTSLSLFFYHFLFTQTTFFWSGPSFCSDFFMSNQECLAAFINRVMDRDVPLSIRSAGLLDFDS